MKKSKIVGVCVGILVVFGLLFTQPIMDAYEKHQAQLADYEEACELMAQERWMEASSLLWHYDIYEDLSDYCRAKTMLKSGDTLGAQIALEGVSPSLQEGDVEQLRREIEADMPAYRERQRLEKEQRLREEKAAARQGVPYVGMDEDWIDITSLGAHDYLFHNNETKNGKIYKANVYDFHNSNGEVIFTARCLFGQVIQVWDDRDDPWERKPYTPVYNYDPFDAQDYSDPEDFYYDHYDDFWDYEDAENYYYEHCEE